MPNPDLYKLFRPPSIDLSDLKPIGSETNEILGKVVETLKTELGELRSQLEATNERLALAEERAINAENATDRANWRTLWVGVLVGLIPFSYTLFTDWGKQSEKTASESQQTSLELPAKSSQRVNTGTSKTKMPHPSTVQTYTTVSAISSKKP